MRVNAPYRGGTRRWGILLFAIDINMWTMYVQHTRIAHQHKCLPTCLRRDEFTKIKESDVFETKKVFFADENVIFIL